MCVQVQQVISELHGQRVVGWYHSHPTFPALPSIIDITNQLMSQKSARDDQGELPACTYSITCIGPAVILAVHCMHFVALQNLRVGWQFSTPVHHPQQYCINMPHDPDVFVCCHEECCTVWQLARYDIFCVG